MKTANGILYGLLHYIILENVYSTEMKKNIELMDLTWPLDVNSIAWPNNKKFTYTKTLEGYQEDGSWYAVNEFCTAEHGGTHLDAPFHFNQSGWKVDDIPLDSLFAKGVVIDVTKNVKQYGKDAELRVEDIEHWERDHGPIPTKCVILVRFGWSQFYGDYEKYMGEGLTPSFPGISSSAAEWIANSNKTVGVGVDTASVDKGDSNTFQAHKILSAKNIYLLENVNVLQDLPARGFSLVIMPIKLKFGTGGPVRIVAVGDGHFANGME